MLAPTTGKSGASIFSKLQAIVTTDRPYSPFSWLRSMRAPLDVMRTAPSAVAASQRALQPDRTVAAAAMVARIDAIYSSVFNQVYADRPGNTVHLFRGGTGIGKSSKVIDFIASDPRTYEWDGREQEDAYPGPVVFLLPTYNNIAELRSRTEVLDLDPTLSNARLAAQARSRGIIHAAQVDAYVKSMADKGLRTAIYRGKLAGGCKRGAEMAAAMEIGLQSSRLCRNGGLRCTFYNSCAAIKQRDELVGAHIVFLPRSFLDLEVPKELERARLVIADEAVWTLLTHSVTFPLSTLDTPRDPPKLPAGTSMSAVDMLGQCRLVAPVIKQALLTVVDPAQAIHGHAVEVPGLGLLQGLLAESVRITADVLEAAVLDRAAAHPMLTIDGIARIGGKASGVGLREEARLYAMIAQRLSDRRPSPDSRIQLLGRDTDNPMIRTSWLSEAQWGDVPALLLDASGDEEITRRIFPGREVVVHEVPADLNLRTLACIDKRFSIRSIVPGLNATAQQVLEAAKLLTEIRQVISAVCGVHAHGFVLVGAPKKVRKAIELGWEKPRNADFVHAGATAGLDFGRQHVALISIGRLEVPISEIDAQVGALTANDPVPEMPIDRLGTGLDEDGKAIYPHIVTRTLHMRDGSDVHFHAHEHAGAMARRVQNQHREENIRQLIGRLRAFYRAETTYVYLVGQAIPEDIIVDEVCSWSDMVGEDSRMWDVVRAAGGMINAAAMAKAAPEHGNSKRYTGWIERTFERLPWLADSYTGAEVSGFPLGVPGHATDIAEFLGVDPASIAQPIGWSVLHCPPAGDGRPDDEIEIVLGDRDERKESERAGIKAVREIVQRRGEWKPGLGQYRAGFGELERARAPLAAWAAMETLRDPWLHSEAEMPVRVGEKAFA